MLHAQGGGSPTPTATPAPSATATPSEATRKHAAERMMERRQHDMAGEQEAQRRIDQLPPEEREAFKRNLRLWRELPPEERQALRSEADERIHTEIEKAIQDSGLGLNKDQREVFALRYRQERRRLERELQDKLNAERARRLPQILDGLKQEFAEKSAMPPASPLPSGSSKPTPSVSVPAATPKPTPVPKPKPSASPSASPSVSPTPSPGG